MPETLFNRDFLLGWAPSDDAVNARSNALLQMDNLELDKNGALQLIHGTQVVWSGFSGLGHTMYSRFINSIRYDYSALDDGSVWRNGSSIISGGDTKNAAFGTAFNYTLICSGSKRIKDSGTAVVNLGVLPPTVAPTVTQDAAWTPSTTIGSLQINNVMQVGSSAILTNSYTQYAQLTTNANGLAIMQSLYSSPIDLTAIGGGFATDDDFVVVNGYVTNPVGVSLEFDILLVPSDPVGDVPTDMYSYAVPDISSQASFDSLTGAFTIKIARIDFNRVGSGALDWSKTYGFRLSVSTNTQGVANVNVWGAFGDGTHFKMQGGSTAQFGTYQYAQVNVNNTGSYLAKSTLGPASAPITLNGMNAKVTVQNPTSVDLQANEAWIYRTGGNLGGTWYRVAVVKSPFTSPILDTTSDEFALTVDITIDYNLISIQQITDKIYDIIGPIEGRWYYFSENFMYPSDLNDPDLINPSLSVRICGSASELFMWARAVSASVVLVGTSLDCYLLTGTFSTFPDGTVDIYFQSLGVRFPPVSCDAVSFGGAIYYLAADGWRMVLPTSFGTTYASQNNQSVVVPNTDRLYRGASCYGYAPPTMPYAPRTTRFPITIAKNKLWCFPQAGGRGEVWDFVRSYWRPFSYQQGQVSACFATQDNRVLVFCPDKKIREYDCVTTKLIDGAGKQQVNMLFPFKDNGKPRQRKDTYTFKSRCYTSSDLLSLSITDEKGNVIPVPASLGSPTTQGAEIFVDLSRLFNPQNTVNPLYLPKAYQVKLSGQVSDLFLEDWSIDFDAHPVPLTALRIYPTNMGSATKKRLRTWPLVIDTLGNSVIFTPDVDGILQTPSFFNTIFKQTVFHYFTTDVFGIDYGGTLYDPTGMMEVWDTGTGQLGQGLQPDIVQNLPIGHEFDQVGPFEIFRYGKLVRMILRTSSEGTPIPFKVYLNDVMVYQGLFNVVPGVEDDYVVDLPKGVSGRILRVELGPCGFVFNRYYMKFQVAISGSQDDTELRWVSIPGGG